MVILYPRTFALELLGPRGSGKTQLLRELRARLGGGPPRAAAAEAGTFPPSLAVCSLPQLEGKAIERLGAVGLNKIPSWLRPGFEQRRANSRGFGDDGGK